ncbi:4Fe-4S binding protein [bacterium BFN5]|nr:4Fe-4S binding protein [bacterium BFN5]
MPIVQVMPIACDQCPIDKFLVTNACRNCLAHHCINSCPKKAIMVVQNRAYIDKAKCIECGLCKKSCPYGAIIEVNRPCEGACDLKAITAGSDRRALIDYDKCVQCGGCKTACPFGAIIDRSEIVQLIQALKSGKRVYAVMAPAFIGQFGAKVQPSQVISALKQVGFQDVYEASYGADIVTIEETTEFLQSVPDQRPFMTTSCCPAFVGMVEKHLPDLNHTVSSTVSPMIATGKVIKKNESVPDQRPFMTTSCCPAFVGMVEKHLPDLNHTVSSTVSPMIATGKVIKKNESESVTVFIGPCIAKKSEAAHYAGVIDFAITFEELACIMVGAGINITAVAEGDHKTTASLTANDFARAGGVVQAVIKHAEKVSSDTVIKSHRAEGLNNCKMALLQMKANKIDANFFEGMACSGGCVGGPGVLTNSKVTGKLVETYASGAEYKTASENKSVVDTLNKGGHWHTK